MHPFRNFESGDSMNASDLSKDWNSCAAALQAAFPDARPPEFQLRGASGDALIRRFAAAHDLTPAEVREMIEDALPDLDRSVAVSRRRPFTTSVNAMRQRPGHRCGFSSGRSDFDRLDK